MGGFLRSRSGALRFGVAALAMAGLALAMAAPAQAGATRDATASRASGASSVSSSSGGKSIDVVPLCSDAAPDHARCFALRRTDVSSAKGVQPNLTIAGFGPADLASAYNLPAGGGAGQTVAIVDAFDDPNAEADLAAYRAHFGLPACTTANGCFSKVDQRGGAGYPRADSGWAGEISLDLDMVSAVAPAAHILLVEADDNFTPNLGAAVDEAVALGAKFVSNSYGSPYNSHPGSGEHASEVTDSDPFYDHPGVAVVASSGDSAYGVSYPAASQFVTSVGGTSLVADGSPRGWSESVWHNSFGGGGSGCSLYEPKPAWQTDSGCANRVVADVSAVADPATGVSVYDSYFSGGWGVFGGTSASSPIIASVFALAGSPAAGTYPSSYPYLGTGSLYDVTSGSSGSCSPAYWCAAGGGYDGPTGLGTPHGISAFSTSAHGRLVGTVTDTSTHAPIAGASVTDGESYTHSELDGSFTLFPPAGTYDVTVSAYGYVSATTPSVAITDGNTTTVNAALVARPRATVTGKVTDASGHGWPLYATVTADGVPGGPVFTDPYTGKYTLTLPQGSTYSLHVNANYPGYQVLTQTVALGTTNIVRNLAVPIDPYACDGPGYAPQTTGVTETFDGTTAPPGWTVTNDTAAGGWVFDDPNHRGNMTGGTGGFAIIDSDFDGSGQTEDTYLTSPVTDFSAASAPKLSFRSDYRDFNSNARVDLSTDDGLTWTTVWDHSGVDARGPAQEDVPLPTAAGQAQVQIRFHYTGTWAWWWQVDDVFLGNAGCVQVPGALIAGTVSRNNPQAGLTGATVTGVDQPADNAIARATPQDPGLGDGFYWMFSSLTGPRGFTAALDGYTPLTKLVTVKENATTKLLFVLAGGQVKPHPTSLAVSVAWHSSTHAKVTLHNTGKSTVLVTLGISPAVDWLSLNQSSITLAKGASGTVNVTFNAAAAGVTGPGTYTSAITVAAPAPLPPIPVTMTVTP